MYISIFSYVLLSMYPHIQVDIYAVYKYHPNPKTFDRGGDQWSSFLTVGQSWGASLSNFCLQFTRNTKDKFLLYLPLLKAAPYGQTYSTNNINNGRVGIKSLKSLTQLLSQKKPCGAPPKNPNHPGQFLSSSCPNIHRCHVLEEIQGFLLQEIAKKGG